MGSRFERHLEQIEAAANNILSMQFSQPGRFTNSQVNRPPITSLIRDTSPYERVLFSSTSDYGFQEHSTKLASKKPVLLASLFDGNIMHQVQNTVRAAQRREEIDIKLLLRGAEDLANIYPIPGLDERIDYLRKKYQELSSSVSLHEELIAAQRTQLDLQRGTAPPPNDSSTRTQRDNPYFNATNTDIESEEAAIRRLEITKLEMETKIRDLDRRLAGPVPSKLYY